MKWTDTILKNTLVPLIPHAVKPNHLTILRLGMAPIVGWLLYLEHYLLGGTFFILLAISDGLDGALARSRNLISDWGRLYDPFADKLLICISVGVLVTKYISAWLAGAIIIVEAMLIVQGSYRGYIAHEEIRVSKWGKFKMIFQSVAVALLIMGLIARNPTYILCAEYTLYAALGIAIMSVFRYATLRRS